MAYNSQNTPNLAQEDQNLDKPLSNKETGDKLNEIVKNPSDYDITPYLPDKNTWLYDIESFSNSFIITFKKANQKYYKIFIKNGFNNELYPNFKNYLNKFLNEHHPNSTIEILDFKEIEGFINDLANNKGVLLGYNNKAYDSYMLQAMLAIHWTKDATKEVHDFNDDIIIKRKKSWESPLYKKSFGVPIVKTFKSILQGDLMLDITEFVGLKQTQACLGENIAETSVPFDIPRPGTDKNEIEAWFESKKEKGIKNIEQLVDKKHLFLTKEGLAYTCLYNMYDVDQTNRVLSIRYDWWKTKLQASLGIIDAHNKLIVSGSNKLALTTNSTSAENVFYDPKKNIEQPILPDHIHYQPLWTPKAEIKFNHSAFNQVFNYFHSQPIMLRSYRKLTNKKDINQQSGVADVDEPSSLQLDSLPLTNLSFHPENISYSFNTFNEIYGSHKANLVYMNKNYTNPNKKKTDLVSEFFLPENVLRWRIWNNKHPITDFEQFNHHLHDDYDFENKSLIDPKKAELQRLKLQAEELKQQVGITFKDQANNLVRIPNSDKLLPWNKPFDNVYYHLLDDRYLSEQEKQEHPEKYRKIAKSQDWIKIPGFSLGERKLSYGTKSVLWNNGYPLEQNTGIGGLHSAILNYEYRYSDKNTYPQWQRLYDIITKKIKALDAKKAHPQEYDSWFTKWHQDNDDFGYGYENKQAWTALLAKYDNKVEAIPHHEYQSYLDNYYYKNQAYLDFLKNLQYQKVWTVDVASLYPSIIINKAKTLFPNDKAFMVDLYHSLKDLRVSLKSKKPDVAQVLKIWLNGMYGKLLYPEGKMYSPQAQFGVVAEGQISLLKLKDMLYPHCMEIQANTDGFYFHPKKGHEQICLDIVGYDKTITDPITGDKKKEHVLGKWEKLTNLSLEFAEHDWIIQADVNNYLMGDYLLHSHQIDQKSIKAKGFMSIANWVDDYAICETKFKEAKGDVLKELSAYAKLPLNFMAKNSLTVVNKCVVNALLYGIKPEDTIKSLTNPLYFQQLIKLGSKYDVLKQGNEVFHFKENRIIATTDNTPGIYKIKTGQKEKVATIFENEAKQKFIKDVEKLYNNWYEEQLFNLLNNPIKHQALFNSNYFEEEELDLINDNQWNDELLTPYSPSELETLDEEDINNKQQVIDLYDKLENIINQDNAPIKLTKTQFIDLAKKGKIDGLVYSDNTWLVSKGYIKSIYPNTPANGALIVNQTYDPLHKDNHWRIADGYLYTIDGKKHQINYDYYLNLSYQRLYAFNPRKWMVKENLKKYQASGKNLKQTKDLNVQIAKYHTKIANLQEQLTKVKDFVPTQQFSEKKSLIQAHHIKIR